MARHLTTAEIAKELGLSRIQVQKLIAAGRLRATKVTQVWVVEEQDLEAVRVRRKAGRPKGSRNKAKIVLD